MRSSAARPDVTVAVTDTLSGIAAEQWDRLVGDDDPFLEHAFLSALETSGCVGGDSSWQPIYVTVSENGCLVAAVAAYEKWDSYGEYIFDWAWADAYQRAGISYYPKIVAACPFTPVNGPRILVHPEHAFEIYAALLAGRLVSIAEQRRASSLHVLFLPESECAFLETQGFLRRVTHQFHWVNRGYETFADFAADLRSSKRKQILKERRGVRESGLKIDVVEGDAVTAEHMDAMWSFYNETTGRKWGQAYLNREFFEEIALSFRDRLVLVTARDNGRLVAATLNAAKNRSLFGRYWGSHGYYPGLHFECCYYRLIDFAIERRIDLFEAGAQGEHKFLRGFVTRPVYSAHWLSDPGGRTAIGNYLAAERGQTFDTIAQYNAQSPLKYAREHARSGD